MPVPYDASGRRGVRRRAGAGAGGPTGRSGRSRSSSRARFAGTVSLRDEGDGPRRDRLRGAPGRARHRRDAAGAAAAASTGGSPSRACETIVWQAFVGNWAQPASWPGGSAFTVEGTLRRYLPHRGARRDAWVGTLLKDDPREPRSTWLDVPELVGDGFRLRPVRESDAPAHPRGHRGADHRALAGAQAGAVHARRRARLRRAAPRARRDRPVRHLGDRGPRRRPDPRHGAVVQLDAGGRVRDRLLDPPGRARPRPGDARRPGW